MNDDAVIILDPVNRDVIDAALASGGRDYIGGNCTVSLHADGVGGLLRAGLVEWITSMTYQAASGAGAQHMRELLEQMGACTRRPRSCSTTRRARSSTSIAQSRTRLRSERLPDGAVRRAARRQPDPVDRQGPRATGRAARNGRAAPRPTRSSAARRTTAIPVDGLCVRIGAMRCHSQALTIKLEARPAARRDRAAASRVATTGCGCVPNTREASMRELSPAAVTGTLDIAGRPPAQAGDGRRVPRRFTVGDQLLWGAAEPLRRMLRILLARSGAVAASRAACA